MYYACLAIVALAAEPAIDFDTQVIPVLTKAGCNTGACHGAAAGRGGFRLSLYGSDPTADYQAIVHEHEGRRINLARPAQSLIIAKPTEQLEHGGGGRLEYQGPGAIRLQRWIAAGAPRLHARKLLDFETQPRRAVLDRAGQSVVLRAIARFDDGTSHDVTAWTVFTPADPAAVAIDPQTAVAKIARRGQHVVLARYLDRVVPLELIVPLADEPVDLSNQPRANACDKHVLAMLEELRLPPSPQADDAAFLRRITLDLTGRLPSPGEVNDFLRDEGGDKRVRRIDGLLGSPEFVSYWTFKLATWLRVGGRASEPAATQAYHAWLREQVAADTPLDQLAKTLLVAQGDSHAVGPANFARTGGSARPQAEFVSEVLLGVRLRCANCHNHPLDRWTQDDYHGLAAIFARVETNRMVRLLPRGDVTHPATGEAALPRIPGQRFLEPGEDHRPVLADWVTSPDNPFFARAMVNRLWKALLGRGLIEPPDDLRVSNPATHPALLDELARDFVSHGCSLRYMLREIAKSAAYQRSSRELPANAADDRFYAHALSRPLEAEVLADAISNVTGVAERFGDLPEGTLAIALTGPSVPSQALDVLGRCSRADSCEGPKGSAAGGISTRLHLLNGPLLNAKITSPDGRLHKLLAAGQTNDAIVEEFYLRALGRQPRPAEREHWRRALGAAAQAANLDAATARRQALEDFLWGLLTCEEFVTNH
jgi:hypothetical protein